ncbi:MAG: ribosome maturation factor RimP [Candidatus Nanopelagicaceae bacterium]
MSIAAELLDQLNPLVEKADALIEDLTVTLAGKRRMVTVLVDHEDRSLTLDEVTSLSRLISERLDSLSLLGDAPFTLEVSSPGVDRPLTKDRHWRKNIGRLVSITMKSGTTTKGRIEGFDGVAIVDGQRIDPADIKRATIEIEFNRKGE